MNGLFSEADLDPEIIKLERQQLERRRQEQIAKAEKKEKKEEKPNLPFDKKLYILDGYAIIYRSYYAHINNPLTDVNGNNCSAYFGFFQILFSLMTKYDMDYLAITMDEKGPTFRHLMYPEYKATRKPAPPDMHAQVPQIIDTLKKMNIPVLSNPGFEADDVIATLTRRASAQGIESVMVTGDKDLCQLINDHVFALRPPQKHQKDYTLIDRNGVKEAFGVYPEQLVDYLSLLGDKSDNVPGIAGVGEKTAAMLLTEYLSFDGIYRHLDSIKPKDRKKLEEGKEDGELSRKLVKLAFDALPVDFDFSPHSTELIDIDAAIKDFEARKMKSLALRAAKKRDGVVSETQDKVEDAPEVVQSLLTDTEKKILIGNGEYQEIDFDNVDKSFSEIATFKGGLIVLDLLTNGFDDNSELLGFSYAYDVKKAFFVPINKDGEYIVSIAQVKKLFDKYFASGKIKLVMQNAKFHLKKVWSIGSDLKAIVFDTMIASWMVDSNSNQYSLSDLCRNYFGHTALNLDDMKDKKDEIKSIHSNLLSKYSSERADYTFRLYRVLERRLYERVVVDAYKEYELPLIRVLAKMEREGILLSSEKMSQMRVEIEERLTSLVDKIHALAGHEFNINSTMQLGAVLFDELKLTTGKKTQRGFSTDTATLEAIRSEHAIVDYVLEYRLLNKLKTTYIDTLPTMVDNNNRIHTTFLQTGTATGRLSSRNPNLQNIPIRTEEGRLIRGAFIPKDGYSFISADYSQIELVVLAHMTQDENLMHAFTSGVDVHRYTASIIFSKPVEEIDPAERRIAKTINFGIMYGMSAFRLSGELGISRHDASEFIKRYFERYSGVKSFVDKTLKDAEENGYIKTMFGHRRDILGIKSVNKTEKAAADRVAVNSVIQGTAAEIMKRAMLDIDSALTKSGMDARILLQVHDELIFEVKEDEKEKVAEIVKEKMENAVKLSIPLRASLEFGKSWGDMH